MSWSAVRANSALPQESAERKASILIGSKNEETSLDFEPNPVWADTSKSGNKDEAALSEADLSLEMLMQKTLEAHGGSGVLSGLDEGFSAVGKLIPSGKDDIYYTYRKYRKAEKWRVDLEGPVRTSTTGNAGAGNLPVKRVLAFNGLAGWRSSGNRALDLNPVRLAQLNDDNVRQPSMLARWKSDDYQYSLLGAGSFRQTPVYTVQVRDAQGSETKLHIDKKNFLVVGLTYYTLDDQGQRSKLIEMDYSSYRPVAGTMFPFKQTKYTDGVETSEIAVSSVSTDKQIDPLLFDRPQMAGKVHLARAIEVPFDYTNKEIVVKGRLNNGEELLFLFDTGASSTIIDRRVAAEHFLLKGGRHHMMAAGGKVDVESATIDRLELGKLIVNKIDARIHNLSPQSKQLGIRLAGIIGTNVISKFVVRIDYAKPELVFIDMDDYRLPPGSTVVPLVQQNAPVVKVTVEPGLHISMLADTGAAFNNLPADAVAKIRGGARGDSDHTTEGTGLDGRKIKLGSLVVDKVTIAGQSLSKVGFTYTVGDDASSKPGVSGAKSDRIAQDKGGFFQNSRLGILGNPFWENFNVTFDYKFQRIVLEPNPVVKVRNQINALVQSADEKLVIYRDYRAAEGSYQKALVLAGGAKDIRSEAIVLGRLANMRRMMAKELGRPEHARSAYDYFVKAQELSRKIGAREIEGRILADWSLLYGDNGQLMEAKQTINRALIMAPQDPAVNVNYAVHLYRESQFAQMQKYIEKSLFLEPGNWQALWYQFKLCEKFYDIAKAKATLKEILRYYPWSKMAQDKLKQYDALNNQRTVSP